MTRHLPHASGLLAISAALLLSACAGTAPSQRFADCPSSPNCLSSKASDAGHKIEPITLRKSEDWACLIKSAQAIGNNSIAVNEPNYVRLEYVSKIMRFVDDLELQQENNLAHIRSASRLGYSDWGVNRKRVEQLQQNFSASCGK
ncbi:MAG: DUF1499 domain-containing protein [Neisseriaceae bacterium]|nr:MAG: DUF1499 domain-containing protein [Neisseriaceae bacterium]